jgi:hypothetical protein
MADLKEPRYPGDRLAFEATPSERESRLLRSNEETVADNWQHRSQRMRCKTCMYFVPKLPTQAVPGTGYDVGRCRRHAPTMSGWPAMFVNDWCGDHKIDESKI